MSPSAREFRLGLYREHLEEASFLYSQRDAYLHDPEVNWPDLHEWEQRFETHVDALIVGGAAAIDLCRELPIDEPGNVHTSVAIFCRHRLKLDLFNLLGRLDPADDAGKRAAIAALCTDVPTAWQLDLVQALAEGPPGLVPVLAKVAGYRRFEAARVLAERLSRPDAVGKSELAWALGRVGDAADAAVLWPLLEEPDDIVREAAALALMRVGDARVLKRAKTAASTDPWARRMLGITGDREAVGILLHVLEREGPDADIALALGLLGDLGAVAQLLAMLSSEAASSAATALNAITGAGLHQQVVVPDETEEGDLAELRDRPGGRERMSSGGRPVGDWERRPLADESAWRVWLDEHKQFFSRKYRWRMGRPHGPAGLLASLESVTTPLAVRSASYEELVLRYGLDVPFELDLPVYQQLRFLSKITAWVSQQSGKFVEGRWYLGGETQP